MSIGAGVSTVDVVVAMEVLASANLYRAVVIAAVICEDIGSEEVGRGVEILKDKSICAVLLQILDRAVYASWELLLDCGAPVQKAGFLKQTFIHYEGGYQGRPELRCARRVVVVVESWSGHRPGQIVEVRPLVIDSYPRRNLGVVACAEHVSAGNARRE